MNINVDNSIVVKFSEFTNNENYKTQKGKENFMRWLKENDSFNKQVDFHKGNWRVEEYFEIIFSILNKNTIKSDNFVLNIISNSFENVISNKDIMQKKIENIKEYDFTKLQKRLLETLPKDTSLNMTIHIVLDGFNAGSIIDEENMLIDAIFWPSDKAKEFQIEGIILHEYHHLGLMYWLKKNKRRNEILKNKSGQELAVRLVENIIGEGAATYFFNQNEDLTSLLAESYGKSIADQYKESLKRAKTDIDTFLKSLENDLEYLLNNKGKYDDMKAITNKYSFDEDFGQPLDKAIGVYMCETIEKQEGRKGLIKTFKEPSLFLSMYNRAAKGLNRLEIKEEIIEEWVRLWDK